MYKDSKTKNYKYTKIEKHVKNRWYIIRNAQKLRATQERGAHTHVLKQYQLTR